MSNKQQRTPRAFYAPSWLSDLAKDEWRRVIHLLDHSTFTEQDLKTLEIYCQSYAKWREAESIIQKEGLTFSTESGYIQQRPEVSIATSSLKDMQSTAKELGLTSASRIRIKKNAGETGGNSNDVDEEIDDMIAK